MTAQEVTDRRKNIVEMVNTIGTQAGRIGAAATAASAIPGPHEPAAAATAVTANVIQFGATAVEHALQPDLGSLAVDAGGTLMSEASNKIPGYGRLVAPVVNEVSETVKNSGVGQNIKNMINERLNR